ncbi:hypothetical protein KY386_02885 [Candidatus Parcubacteria bacterium]|nr:hypothetical protein [Candidatus Parcubacteria bacterium]
MEFKLPAAIGSPEQLQEALVKLESYIDLCSRRSVKQRTGAGSGDDEQLRGLGEQLGEMLGEAAAGNLPAEQAEQLKGRLEELVRSAPRIHLTLPELPPAGLKQQVVSWVRTNLSPDALVVFHRNRALAGGFAVRAGSRVYDFSFRKRLLDQSAAVARILNDV